METTCKFVCPLCLLKIIILKATIVFYNEFLNFLNDYIDVDDHYQIILLVDFLLWCILTGTSKPGCLKYNENVNNYNSRYKKVSVWSTK